MSKYFIGIVPPEPMYSTVLNLQHQYMDRIGVEPHITLKAQSNLTIDENWIEEITNLINHTSKFNVTQKKTAYCGKEVLYVSFDSLEIHDLHKQIVGLLNVTKEMQQKYFEGDLYVPHLTVGKQSYGDDISSGNNINNLLNMEKQLNQKDIFKPFQVNEVYIYKYVNNKYVRLKKVGLKD
ncbi:2'-5' RNA ligase family protein [Mammaliicoccus sciuri]|uniref:2'-5' RNA ligase family protein n=1 Tax=Mammaliicoccus sciuri TaxID=1296 RepID=UPI0015F9BA59|nr:2'-5' RNA ligase family protein [Mammaliicoccus sciuri]